MHQEALAEKAVVQEKDKLFAFAGKVKKITQGKRCVVCIGRMLMYFHPAGILETLSRLEMQVEAIILFDNYNPKERKLMVEAVSAQCQAPIIDQTAGQQLLETVDLVLTTHEITNNQDINTNLKMGLPLENINKIAGPMIEAWAGEVFAGIRDEANNEYCLINVEAQERLGMADIILQFRKEDSVLTGNIDVKATANDIPNSGKGPNITSFSRIRTAYVKDPDFMFIILSIKHRVYSERNRNTGLVDGVMEVVDYNAYDLKFISDADINYNPALGTGQIQIKDIHYVTYQYRTTWEMCQLLDQKYLHSSRRTIDDFYREATRNQWIKS